MFKRATIALVFLASLFAFSPVIAQDGTTAPKIALINIKKVETESIAWKSLSEQINARRETLKSEIQSLQSTLEEKAKLLETERALLSAEAFADKVAVFKKERASLDQAARSRKQNLDKAYLEARGQIRKALNKVMLGYVQQENINLVLKAGDTESTVYFASTNLLIDAQVLTLLDKEIQSVTLPTAASQ